MKISELSSALSKVSQIAGDVEVVLRDASTGAETELKTLGLKLDPSTGESGSSVTIEHSAKPSTPPHTEPGGLGVAGIA